MNITIHKDNDFKNVGIEVYEIFYNKQFMRNEKKTVYRHGKTLGTLSKDVFMSEDNWELVKFIIQQNAKKSEVENFRWTFFDILKENKIGYEGKPFNLSALEKQITNIENAVQNALEQIQ